MISCLENLNYEHRRESSFTKDDSEKLKKKLNNDEERLVPMRYTSHRSHRTIVKTLLDVVVLQIKFL